jgi:hypothetical protein
MSDPANNPSALSSIPPPVTADRKQITDKRVRTSSDVVAAFGVMYTADLWRSRERALCQAACDNAAPYSDSKSKAMGTYGRSNFNPGFARKSTAKEQNPYIELMQQMDVFSSTPTKHGTPEEQEVWEPIIAEGFTKMLQRWPKWDYLYQLIVSLFVRHGVAVPCWTDESDWQPWAYGMQHFKFPERSKPCEDDLDMCGWRSQENCRDLYRKIQNEKVAAKCGWNVAAVKAAIKKACVQNDTNFDYERLEQRWKAMEVLDGAKPPSIDTIHLLVREVDGTITHLAAPATGSDGDPVFYESRGKYRSMRRFMTLFTFGVGTDGFLHSIRGHTSNIYNMAVSATRTLNAYADMAMFAATPHLECADDNAMQTLPFRKVGYMTMIAKGNKFQDVKVPNFDQTLLPLYSTFTSLLEGESSGAPINSDQRRSLERKTNMQELNERMEDGQLTTAALGLFYPAFGRFLKEIMRRVKRRNYRSDEPGGEDVWWLRNYLKTRDVPLDALYKLDVDNMEVNNGIGNGSQAARLGIANSLMEDYYLLDDQGRNEVLRLRFSTRVGARKANRIVPPVAGLRPGQQVDNADDQNGFLVSRNPAQILSVKWRPDQNNHAHVKTHLEFLKELWPMTQEQDQRTALETIQPLWAHGVDDLQHLDPKDPLFIEAKQAFREMSEWVVNTAKELAAEEDRAADTAAREGAPNGAEGMNGKDAGGEGPNMSNFARAIDARAKLEYTVKANEEKLAAQREMNAEKIRAQKESNALNAAGKVQDMNLKNLDAKMKFLNKPDAK